MFAGELLENLRISGCLKEGEKMYYSNKIIIYAKMT